MDINDDNKKDRFQLVELILVAADIYRTFVATRLEREHDNGEKFYTANVKVHEGEIISASEDETAVEKNLDIMCVLKLDFGLHEIVEKSIAIFYDKYFYN